jgi:hypothetical protein
VDFEDDIVTENLTLYAHWTIKTYGVSGTVLSGFDAIPVRGLTVACTTPRLKRIPKKTSCTAP